MNVFVFLSLLGSAGALKAYKIKLSSDGLAKNAKKETSSTYSDSTQMLITNGAMKDQALIQSDSQERAFWRGKKKGIADYTTFLDHMTQFYGNVSQNDSACLTKCWAYGLDKNNQAEEYSMTFVFGSLLSTDSPFLSSSPVEVIQNRRGGRLDGSPGVATSGDQMYGCRKSLDGEGRDLLFFSDSAAHECFYNNTVRTIFGQSIDETRGACVPWDSFGKTNCGGVENKGLPVCMTPTIHVYNLKCTRQTPTPTPAPTSPGGGSPSPADGGSPSPADGSPSPADGSPSPADGSPSPATDGDGDPVTPLTPTLPPSPTPPTPASAPNSPPNQIIATPRPTKFPTPQPPTPSPTKWAGDTAAIRSPPTPIKPWHCDSPTFPEREAKITELFVSGLWGLIDGNDVPQLSSSGGICSDGSYEEIM